MSVRKVSIMKLASAAYEMGLQVLRGPLERAADGQLQINRHELADWLREFEGQEIVLIAGSLEDEREPVIRTCLTCGRDYEGHECSYCSRARARLRGY